MLSIGFRDIASAVGTAVVDQNVFKICVALREHTFDALAKILGRIVKWSNDAYEWRGQWISLKLSEDACV